MVSSKIGKGGGVKNEFSVQREKFFKKEEKIAANNYMVERDDIQYVTISHPNILISLHAVINFNKHVTILPFTHRLSPF